MSVSGYNPMHQHIKHKTIKCGKKVFNKEFRYLHGEYFVSTCLLSVC